MNPDRYPQLAQEFERKHPHLKLARRGGRYVDRRTLIAWAKFLNEREGDKRAGML